MLTPHSLKTPISFNHACTVIGFMQLGYNGFQGTAMFLSSSNSQIHTDCKGHLLITKQIDTQRLVLANIINLVIKPAKQPIVDLLLKYIFLKCLKASRFINRYSVKAYLYLKLFLGASLRLTINRQQVTKYENPISYCCIKDDINYKSELDITQKGLKRKKENKWKYFIKIVLAFIKLISTYNELNYLKKPVTTLILKEKYCYALSTLS